MPEETTLSKGIEGNVDKPRNTLVFFPLPDICVPNKSKTE